MLFFAFASCEKDTATGTNDSASNAALLLKNVDPPALHPEGCDCEYQIVSISYSPSAPSGYYFGYDVAVIEQCSGTFGACNYFNFAEHIQECDPNYVPGCSNVVSPGISKPTGWYPFKCYQECNSDFELILERPNFWAEPGGIMTACNPHETVIPSGSITLEIQCKGSTWQSTGTFSIPFSNGVQNAVATISLGGMGCGCAPVVSISG